MPSKSLARVINVLYDEGRETEPSKGFREYLHRLLDLDWDNIQWDGTVRSPGLEKNKELVNKLRKFVSTERITFDSAQRMKHSMGSSSLEMVRAKNGVLPDPVDAVIFPLDNEAEDLVSSFKDPDLKFTIFGGGSSVTGGIIPGGEVETVCIDTSNLKDFQLEGNIAIAGAGLTAGELEQRLNSNNRTFGFFPESIQQSTLGGWISTKATGQESNQYGDIEDLVLGVRIARSDGVLKDQKGPRSSAGMMARDIALGSEGRRGLILSATLETYPLPRTRFFSTNVFPSFSEAINHFSKMRTFPSVLRVMDDTETELALLDLDAKTRTIVRRYLSLRGIVNGSMVIMMSNDVNFKKYMPGSVWVGSRGGKRWFNTRFSRPGIANALWKRGLVVDTMETSCNWNNVEKIHSAVTSEFYRVLRENNASGVIFAHLSHQYQSGTCIYFSFIFKAEKEEKTLLDVRNTIEETILSESGSITHHHGLGSYFPEYLEKDIKGINDLFTDSIFKGPVNRKEK